jgi:hypothetical protein
MSGVKSLHEAMLTGVLAFTRNSLSGRWTAALGEDCRGEARDLYPRNPVRGTVRRRKGFTMAAENAAAERTSLAEAGHENELETLRARWGTIYDVGTAVVSDRACPVTLWLAIRLEGERPEPLLGFTPAALDAAMAGDQATAR